MTAPSFTVARTSQRPAQKMLSAPSIMQQTPLLTSSNAEIKGILSRALEMTAATSGSDASSTAKPETSTSSAPPLVVRPPESSSSSSSSASSLSKPPAAVSSSLADAGTLAGIATGTSALATMRRSGRSRKPSSKAVENKANAEALAAAGLGHDEYAVGISIVRRESSSSSSESTPPTSSPSSPVADMATSSGAFATSAVATISPKSGKKTWKKPEGKPKRPLSAYNIFFKEERARLVAEINGGGGGGGGPGGDGPSSPSSAEEAERRQTEAARSHRKTHGMGFAGLAQNIAGKWKGLSSQDRRPFEEKAAVDKARYVREVAVWKALLQESAEQADREQYSAAGVAPATSTTSSTTGGASATSGSHPATPRAQPVTDASSEDETPRRRAARSKAGKKGKTPKKATPKRKQSKSAKKQRSRTTAKHHHHHQEQQVQQVQHYNHQHHPTGTVRDVSMADQTGVESAAAATAQGYAPAPTHGPHPQQWDGLDQVMMLGVGAPSSLAGQAGLVDEGDLHDILSLDF